MKNLTLSSFGETLQTLRKQKHLTQQELAAKLGVHRNTIGFWERGDYLPASKGIVLELARQMQANEGETRQLLEASLTALTPYWSIPYARNPLFVGREEHFQKLHAHLHPQGGSISTSYAVYGLAGIGKTQMAVEYAYRYSPLRSYQSHRRELLARRGKPQGDHPASVAATFSLTYQRVKQVHPAAAELLCLCAFLAPDAIPEELIALGSSSLGSVLQPVAAHPYQLDEAIAVLRSFSLIRRQVEARTLSLHRLTQTLLKDQLYPVAVQQWSERAVRVVNAAFPQVEFATWSVCERYLPQAQVCRFLIEEASLSFPDAARLLQKMGIYLRERGRNEEARKILEQALAQQEQHLGPEHPEVATTLNHLAGVHWNLGEIAQMEVLDQRSLRIREQQLGPTHPLTAEILNDIGYSHMRQGHYQQAALQLDRALAICEQQLGPEHPQTATCLMNLGELYREQKQYAQAEAVLQRALRIFEQHLGPDHPWKATCLRRLGNLSQAQGRDVQAEALLRHALWIFERYLQADHRWIAGCLEDLRNVACGQDEAKQR